MIRIQPPSVGFARSAPNFIPGRVSIEAERFIEFTLSRNTRSNSYPLQRPAKKALS
ncbi:hypothetical protein NIES2104_53620 [Leptolyngbya sp. NIES-2104]|nr:hypothetical protein NIES2104_53620 [Leptolyngbya sp. NIES-2104]